MSPVHVPTQITAGGPRKGAISVPEQTSNLRVTSYQPLVSTERLLGELPLADENVNRVSRAREEIINVLNHRDDRLLVVVGPCSIHDPAAAIDYAERLKKLSTELADELCIVMRAYFEKPRTTVGWKGLINDPHLDESCDTNEGLRLARHLLLDLIDLDLAVGCEFIDPITPQFIADTVSWGAIGARTTESQVHRQLASGLSMPIGFKNGTDGSVQVAIDALESVASPHIFFGVNDRGAASIVSTTGNPDCHIILRGGRKGPNYDAQSVAETLAALEKSGKPKRLMIDCSHGNSRKDHRLQPVAAQDIATQVAGGQQGIVGVMLESFLVEGRQDLVDKDQLTYGQSITDACMSWDMTKPVLTELAESVRSRRAAVKARS